MRKTIAFLSACLIILGGCSANAPQSESPAANTHPPVSASSTSAPTPKPVATPNEPEKEDAISDELNTYMAESFGSTTWFQFIDTYTVYKLGNEYSATVSLTEKPYDYSLSLLMWTYFTDEESAIVSPIIIDAAAGLGLDDIELCLLAEGLSKIYKGTDLSIAYSSLSALDIPVYKYCADALGVSESDVRSNIDVVKGATAVDFILNGLTNDFSGSFTGLSMESTERIAFSAMANFDTAYISEITILDPDGKELGTHENRVPKK